MKIGGFAPFTLLDFPGRVAAMVFTQGCNYRCPYCHNSYLIPLRTDPDRTLPEADVRRQIETYSDKLDGVVVSGGEPTLQSDLADLLTWIRVLGLDTKLETNGSRPGVIAALLQQNLLSSIAMDVKAPPSAYQRVAGLDADVSLVLESMESISKSGIEHEFRTTWDHALLSAEEIEGIRSLVPAGSPYRVQVATPRSPTRPTAAGLLAGVPQLTPRLEP